MYGVIQWENEKDMDQAMPKLVWFLYQRRKHLQEMSLELGVADPVSGTVVTALAS